LKLTIVLMIALDEETLVGSYIPTDRNGSIHFSNQGLVTSGRTLSFRTEMIRCPQMSSISYHAPSHRIMLTSREPDHSCGLYFFSPLLSEPEDAGRPQWLLGETNHYQKLSIRHRLRDEWLVHKSTPAPASSDLICAIGTNAGILRVLSDGFMSWISPRSQPKGAQSPQEIFDLDFQQGNHNVLLAGGRQPRLWATDLRAPEAQWRYARHASSIAHVRSLNEHQVLVAGLQNSMALYDLRFMDFVSSSGSGDGRGAGSHRGGGRASRQPVARPLLSFPSYRNAAHVHFGWDVSPQLNLIASAQDDGTVHLFSLRSGRQLAHPGAAIEDPSLLGHNPYHGKRPASSPGGSNSRGNTRIPTGWGGIHADTPIRAMMFQQMPHESLPSLFIGDGPLLKKFSFGVVGLDDEA
jgi:WD40 repeat protein